MPFFTLIHDPQGFFLAGSVVCSICIHFLSIYKFILSVCILTFSVPDELIARWHKVTFTLDFLALKGLKLFYNVA